MRSPPRSRTGRRVRVSGRTSGSVSITQLRHKPPRNAQRDFGRGAKFSETGNHQRAAAEFERAIADDPDFAIAYERLGVEYAQSGRAGDAKAMLQRSLALDASSWIANYDLGLVLYRTGDLAAAELSLGRALELSHTNPQVHFLLGLLLLPREETRSDGLKHLQFAARSIPQANEILRSLDQN